MNVKVEIGHYYFKVFINDLLHVCIDKDEFVGIKSYNDCETQCVIEYITKTNKIETQQDTLEKWEQILKELNENL